MSPNELVPFEDPASSIAVQTVQDWGLNAACAELSLLDHNMLWERQCSSSGSQLRHILHFSFAGCQGLGSHS